MTYVYCRNKDTSNCAHHLWGVWGMQQDLEFLRSIFIFCLSWAPLAEGADQSNNLRVGWSEAAHFGSSWPGTFGHPQQVRPDKVWGWHGVLSHREALSNQRSGGNVGFQPTSIPNPFFLLTDPFFLLHILCQHWNPHAQLTWHAAVPTLPTPTPE